MPDFTAEQFDPGDSKHSNEYIKHAFCTGPYMFFAATTRGPAKIAKGDWIVEFENGERIAVTNDTYQKYFAPRLLAQAQPLFIPEIESTTPTKRSRKSKDVGEEDSELRESGDDSER